MVTPRADARAFIGLGVLVCLGFLYGGSLLFLPWWAVLILYVVWLPLMVRGCRLFGSDPRGVAVAAGVGVAAWLAAVAIAVAAQS